MQVADLELKGHTFVKGGGGGGDALHISFSEPQLWGANFWSSNPHLPTSTAGMLDNIILENGSGGYIVVSGSFSMSK